jgi:hypothetical protein
MTDKPDETKACPHGQWNTDYERLVYTCPLCGAVIPFDEREVLIEKGLRERERESERKKPGILGILAPGQSSGFTGTRTARCDTGWAGSRWSATPSATRSRKRTGGSTLD